ncbi:hypothetical protein B0H10DRAFT_2112450, partial [Mycena sp. CBHHK59/15]
VAYFDSSLSAHFGPILAVLLSLSPPYQVAQTRIPAGADDIPVHAPDSRFTD